MGDNDAASEEVEDGSAQALPEFNPWRAAGWIFRDGDCIAIERRDDDIRARALAD
jgi:hypothetical protein